MMAQQFSNLDHYCLGEVVGILMEIATIVSELLWCPF